MVYNFFTKLNNIRHSFATSVVFKIFTIIIVALMSVGCGKHTYLFSISPEKKIIIDNQLRTVDLTSCKLGSENVIFDNDDGILKRTSVDDGVWSPSINNAYVNSSVPAEYFSDGSLVCVGSDNNSYKALYSKKYDHQPWVRKHNNDTFNHFFTIDENISLSTKWGNDDVTVVYLNISSYIDPKTISCELDGRAGSFVSTSYITSAPYHFQYQKWNVAEFSFKSDILPKPLKLGDKLTITCKNDTLSKTYNISALNSTNAIDVDFE